MITRPYDDEQYRRIGITGIPPVLQGIPRFSNADNVEMSDSEFTPPPPKQTFPVPEPAGAPADFPGAVIPNPDNVQPRLDTEGPPPDPTTVDSKMSYVSAPNISAPQPQQGINVPPISPQYQRDLAASENLGKGSGIDQFQDKHHILGGILRGLDIAGSFLAPNLAVNIPGTTLHHQMLEAENRGNLAGDVAEQQHQAQTEGERATTGLRQAQTAQTEAETEALNRPQSTIEKLSDGSIVQLRTNKDTGETTAHFLYKGDPKVQTEVKEVMKGGKPHQVLFNSQTGQEVKDLGEAPPPQALLTQEVFHDLTPAEIEAAGLPKGTSAQRSSRGEIKVVNKPATANLSQKDVSAARQKMVALNVARQQLQAVKDRFAALKDTFSAGPGGGYLPTEAGRSFDAAVDQMRSSISSLTRTPGIGSMSDFETRLDQAKMPSRSEYESVTGEKIAGLESMLNQLESGYKDMLGGDESNSGNKGPAVGTVEDGYRFKGGNPSDPNSWEKVKQ